MRAFSKSKLPSEQSCAEAVGSSINKNVSLFFSTTDE
jgi:hypothetical protein